jgi:hypothetical protein
LRSGFGLWRVFIRFFSPFNGKRIARKSRDRQLVTVLVLFYAEFQTLTLDRLLDLYWFVNFAINRGPVKSVACCLGLSCVIDSFTVVFPSQIEDFMCPSELSETCYRKT